MKFCKDCKWFYGQEEDTEFDREDECPIVYFCYSPEVAKKKMNFVLGTETWSYRDCESINTDGNCQYFKRGKK